METRRHPFRTRRSMSGPASTRTGNVWSVKLRRMAARPAERTGSACFSRIRWAGTWQQCPPSPTRPTVGSSRKRPQITRDRGMPGAIWARSALLQRAQDCHPSHVPHGSRRDHAANFSVDTVGVVGSKPIAPTRKTRG
jgi:hypothetical protein